MPLLPVGDGGDWGSECAESSKRRCLYMGMVEMARNAAKEQLCGFIMEITCRDTQCAVGQHYWLPSISATCMYAAEPHTCMYKRERFWCVER